MLLKYLFSQYNTSKGPAWGSKFMKVCGELVLGTPAQKGLGHLRKDLQDSYYYIKEDRQLPLKSLMAWEIQSILVAQYREVEAPQVSRATFFVLLPFIFACVGVASLFNGTMEASIRSNTESSPVSGWFDGKDDVAGIPTNKLNLDDCLAIQAKLERQEIKPTEIPDFAAKSAACQSLQRKGAQS